MTPIEVDAADTTKSRSKPYVHKTRPASPEAAGAIGASGRGKHTPNVVNALAAVLQPLSSRGKMDEKRANMLNFTLPKRSGSCAAKRL